MTCARASLVAVGSLLAGCSPEASPEDQVRAVLMRAEEGAEARDLSAVMKLVDDGYADTRGQDKEEIRALLRGFFVLNQSVHLLMRVEDVKFPSGEVAEARVTVGMLGVQSQEDWSFAAEVYEFDVRLMRDGEDWMLTSAEWRRPGS